MVVGRHIQTFFGGYDQRGKAAVVSPGDSQQLLLHAVTLQNRSGAAMDMGVGVRLSATSDNGFKFGTLVALADPQLTDASVAIAAGTAQNIFTTTVNNGFLVQAKSRFSLIGLTISQVQTGAPVYAYEYWNGSAWTALPDMIATPVYTSTTDIWIVFSPPRDWVTGGDATTGVSSGYYAVRVRATTAPGQIVKANAIWVAKFLHFQADVASNGCLSLVASYDLGAPIVLDALEGILPYFETATAANLVTARYQSAD
jgi:hypothetical protein